jgi:hypothetical protein
MKKRVLLAILILFSITSVLAINLEVSPKAVSNAFVIELGDWYINGPKKLKN